jgi:hypothetical protein
MTSPSPTIRRAVMAALLATLTGLFAACGPGVGGSGTGEDMSSALPAFGASPAGLCASDLAALLACPGSSSPAVDLRGGTSPVSFAGTSNGLAVALWLQGNRVDLRLGCTVLRFRGEWGQLGAQAPRFYGYLDNGDGAPVIATLEARVVDGSRIELTLRDANGSTLAGPLQVARGDPPVC